MTGPTLFDFIKLFGVEIKRYIFLQYNDGSWEWNLRRQNNFNLFLQSRSVELQSYI